MAFEFFDLFGGIGPLSLRLSLENLQLGILQGANSLPVGAVGNHPGGKDNQVRLNYNIPTKEGVRYRGCELNRRFILYGHHFALGEEGQRIILGRAVKLFILPGCSHIFVNDVYLGVGILFCGCSLRV